MANHPILSFFKLIRIGNVLIAIATQWLFYYLLFHKPSDTSSLPFLQNKGILFLLPATGFIAISGYIINNIFDRKADQITKLNQAIVGNQISLRASWFLYIISLITGLGLGLGLAVKMTHFGLGALFIFLASGLFLYSYSWKRIPLLGNLFIAFSCATIIFILPLSAWQGVHDAGIIQMYSWIFELCIMFSLFAFISTLIREWIKDLEDIDGDKQFGFKTMAVIYPKQTQTLSFVSVISLGVALLLWSIIHFEKLNLAGKWYLFLLLIIVAFITRRIPQAREKASFAMLSLWLKIFMILGLLYILFWHV